MTEFVRIHGLRVPFIPFNQVAQLLQSQQVSRYEFDPNFQQYGRSGDRVITLMLENGTMYVARVRYEGNSVYPPTSPQGNPVPFIPEYTQPQQISTLPTVSDISYVSSPPPRPQGPTQVIIRRYGYPDINYTVPEAVTAGDLTRQLGEISLREGYRYPVYYINGGDLRQFSPEDVLAGATRPADVQITENPYPVD